ncbi:hypothetical protein Q3A66_13555 [Hymenobacter sp. BT770]|uniref:hypothetical protein n=1 Tax=Hymenobacter sp. BT770 TaxID=2886942 RepID=UPI001D120A62|nr:hypothetical protein [Hymenobacter sp. BT770]MCC3153979.1 hypothetical protein [Hymenobacter sp. BT770]MDO3416091.1 hypothetical protein [Hymenobacter sp. BT770]
MNSLPQAKEGLYFQNAAGKLSHNPAGFVRLVWSSERATLEAIKAIYEQALALLLNSGSRKILSDHGQRAPLSGPAQEWLTQNWMPRAISQARARYCAIVEGADPMHRLSTQSVVASSPSGLVFQRFSSVEEAQAWLVSARV